MAALANAVCRGKLADGGATAEGWPYVVMEHIEGERIDRYCDAHRLPIRARLELFRSVFAAVQHAHGHLVVHRDLKPGNILVTAGGVPKLLDFGIAKLLDPTGAGPAPDETGTGIRLMTPTYASPEQVAGAPVTTAVDIYSLGVVLYELLTGRLPYQAQSALEIEHAITDEEPTRPSDAPERPGGRPAAPSAPEIAASRSSSVARVRRELAGDLDTILLKALRKEPVRRYASVEQFADDVRRYLGGLPVLARGDTLRYRTGPASWGSQPASESSPP